MENWENMENMENMEINGRQTGDKRVKNMAMIYDKENKNRKDKQTRQKRK